MTQRQNDGPIITKEKETVEKMIHIYCTGKHTTSKNQLCDDCSQLLDYSRQRLNSCRFGDEKPTCRKCEVHCYKSDRRQEIRTVMRYSGPRLVLRAPVEWIRHKIHDQKNPD
ncbi:MAG: nitrous oxide-stimulated promoter family protein [Candidatus Thorarchaeota archaeon]